MKSLADLQKMRDEAKKQVELRDSDKDYRVVVGMATCGIAAGARPVLARLVEELANKECSCVVTQTGCIGMCTLEPIVEVYDKTGSKTTYCKVTPDVAAKILEEHVCNGKVVEEYLISSFKK